MKSTKLETIKEYEARTGKRYCGLIVAANNVRTELKAAFPGVKFSVRTSRFAGGDDLRVEWTDGPTEKQVNEIISKYAAGSFDGMIDLYTYDNDEFNKLYGSAKYVSASRSYSESFLTKIAQIVIAEYGKNVEVKVYKSGTAYFESEEVVSGGNDIYYWNMENVAYRKASETAESELEAAMQAVLNEKIEAIIENDETVIELDTIQIEPASTDIEIEEVKEEVKKDYFNLFSWGMEQFQAVYELVS